MRPGLDERLRAGDEAAFVLLLDAWSASMHRLAKAFVGDAATARDVVQQAWRAVIVDVAQVDGGPSLKHEVYRTVVGAAQLQARRDRGVPVAVDDLADNDEPTIPRSRFRPDGVSFPRHWSKLPSRWPSAEDTAQAAELRHVVVDAVRRLPPIQAAVLTLRDIEGCDLAETGAVLDLTVPTQLALLHRGRTAVRVAIEEYLDGRVTDRHFRDTEDA